MSAAADPKVPNTWRVWAGVQHCRTGHHRIAGSRADDLGETTVALQIDRGLRGDRVDVVELTTDEATDLLLKLADALASARTANRTRS